MMAGHADTLTFIQRIEGNAEAVFENTGLKKLDAATQLRDRADWTREWDAIAVAESRLGIDPKAALTTSQYLAIENTIRSDAQLQELAMQGHGLNSPSQPKYNGYTNDFQNNTDNTTLYIGGGPDNNEAAVPALFDDFILSHLTYPTVTQDGHLEQLNQNGASEDVLREATGGLNFFGTQKILTAADFSKTAGNASNTVPPPADGPQAPAPAGKMYALYGALVDTTLTVNGHVWTADVSGNPASSDYGLYTTTADLAAEWKSAYASMLAGHGGTLTAIQRLEGNAEAVFENTGLANVVKNNPTQARYDRMDAQREFDALAGVMTQLGLGAKPLTQADYLAIEHALQNTPANAALEELGLQGHGLNGFSQGRYGGYTRDFQNNVDTRTLFAGGGINDGERAVPEFFDDNILTHALFPTIARNGEIVQLNQNGNGENTLQASIEALNDSMFNRVYKAGDFNIPGNEPIGVAAGTDQPAGKITTGFGGLVDDHVTIGNHTWQVGSDGTFHTTTNLATEWRANYQQMLAGNGASLTFEQRWEGNAEAFFEFTGLNNPKISSAKLQQYREDAQREMDAVTAIMLQLGLGGGLLSRLDYLNIENTLQNNALLEELALQGHGYNSPPLRKYNGFTNDFQNNVDGQTNYIGGGLNNGENALTDKFDDSIMTHVPFPTVSTNGVLDQDDQNADNENAIDDAVGGMNDTLFRRVFVAGDFSKTQTSGGPEVYVSPAMQAATTPALPTPGAGQMSSLEGYLIPTTIVANGHTWIADSAGRYQTATDLTLEWYNAYQLALAGKPLTLTQHWEANAEAVFENTGLAQISEGQQAIDRADTQREIDAAVTVINQLGITGPLSQLDYLRVERTLQSNPALEQLAIEGHGLNNPWQAGVTEYLGFTNDFQYGVDNRTLYVGGGYNTGQRAIADFFDDSIMTHLAFATVAKNGELKQLNQNGNVEQSLLSAVAALNMTLYTRIYRSSDFLTPGKEPMAGPAAAVAAAITTLYGDTIAGTQVLNGHSWTVDAAGLFHTSTNLEMEWRSNYQVMLSGHGDTLTAAQRMEGNAEAVFENTGINFQWNSAAKEAAYREDVQRQIDAIAEAMRTDKTAYNIDPKAPLTEATYLRLGTTIQTSAVLQEFSLQGHGVSGAGARYKGAYGDFMSGADWSTYFVGGGSDNGLLALPYIFNDVMSNLAFAAVYQNGKWDQLDMGGNVAGTVIQAATALNNTMFRQVFVAGDFSKDKTTAGPVMLVPNAPSAAAAPISSTVVPAGMQVTLSGELIATTLVVNGHTWTADANGQYHTANLASEWTGLYASALANGPGSLTPMQRAEANAEAVLEATGQTKLSPAIQQAIREDVQRQLDAMAGAIAITATALNIPQSAVLLPGSYIPMERAMHNNAALEELAIQGFGLNGLGGTKYSGYLNDFKNASPVKYTGGGVNNNKNALSVFMGENVMSFTPFAVIWRGGKLVQLNQNGEVGDTLTNAIQAIDDTIFNKVYKKTDFH